MASCEQCDWSMPSTHIANEQKLSVLTVSRYSIHGTLGKLGESIGSAVSRSLSSEELRCHTMSLLSLPCLNRAMRSAVASGRQYVRTYVRTRSGPHEPRPSIAFSWALHTATGLLKAKFHDTTHPSASPVSKRALPWVKCKACIWAE